MPKQTYLPYLALITHVISHSFALFCIHACRDPGVEDKMNPFAEQEAWEEHQIGIVVLNALQ